MFLHPIDCVAHCKTCRVELSVARQQENDSFPLHNCLKNAKKNNSHTILSLFSKHIPFFCILLLNTSRTQDNKSSTLLLLLIPRSISHTMGTIVYRSTL